jgi:hypothetical protein
MLASRGCGMFGETGKKKRNGKGLTVVLFTVIAARSAPIVASTLPSHHYKAHPDRHRQTRPIFYGTAHFAVYLVTVWTYSRLSLSVGLHSIMSCILGIARVNTSYDEFDSSTVCNLPIAATYHVRSNPTIALQDEQVAGRSGDHQRSESLPRHLFSPDDASLPGRVRSSPSTNSLLDRPDQPDRTHQDSMALAPMRQRLR